MLAETEIAPSPWLPLEAPWAAVSSSWHPADASKYYRARYYDPKIGRFISEDPIGFAAGPNFYTYVGNRPTIYIDPLGLDAFISFWPKDANGYGHPGIGVNNKDTEGFYSTNKPTCLLWGCGDPGRVLNDREHHPGETPSEIVRIRTTPEQDALMQAAIDARKANPGDYYLHKRNCARFVADVLGAAGIEGVSGSKYPQDVFESIKKIQRQQEQPAGPSTKPWWKFW